MLVRRDLPVLQTRIDYHVDMLFQILRIYRLEHFNRVISAAAEKYNQKSFRTSRVGEAIRLAIFTE